MWSQASDFIVKTGIEPSIIAALLYIVYKLITDGQKATTSMTCAVNDLTNAVGNLAEYVRGGNHA